MIFDRDSFTEGLTQRRDYYPIWLFWSRENAAGAPASIHKPWCDSHAKFPFPNNRRIHHAHVCYGDCLGLRRPQDIALT